MTGLPHVPDEIDWVKLRLDSTPAAAFARLQAMVQQDVNTLNSDTGIRVSYELKGAGAETFIVSKQSGADWLGSVLFDLTREGIDVRKSEGRHPELLFEVVPFLTPEGTVRFRVGSEVLTAWQLTRKALEPLFFATS
jgi:hypothetical protein